MGLCGLPSDHMGVAIPTYVLALLPWAVLPAWDPLNQQWRSFRHTFVTSVVYLILSILPYAPLITYAILQGCSNHPEEGRDNKEFLTAIVAMIVSLWNIRRSVRGLCALYDAYRTWESVDDDPKKITCWEVKVSSNLVDNDWPGEAPRVPYIENMLKSGDEVLDERDRLCMQAVWSLWMLTNPRSREDGERFYFRHVPLFSDEGAPRYGPRMDFRKWWDGRCTVRPSRRSANLLTSQAVARILYSVWKHKRSVRFPSFLQYVHWEDWERHDRNLFTIFRSALRLINCGISQMSRSRFGIVEDVDGPSLRGYGHQMLEKVKYLTESEVSDQVNKLPRAAQSSLRWIKRDIAGEWAVHLQLNRERCGGASERVTRAFGLPCKCVRSIDGWMRDEHVNFPGMLLSMFLVLERHPRPWAPLRSLAYHEDLHFRVNVVTAIIDELMSEGSDHWLTNNPIFGVARKMLVPSWGVGLSMHLEDVSSALMSLKQKLLHPP